MLKPPMLFIVFLESGLAPIDPSLAAELQVACRSAKRLGRFRQDGV
jgi:hypothetical protein